MMNDLFQQALGIGSPWHIKSIEFNADNKRLDIHVDFKRGAHSLMMAARKALKDS